MGWKHDVKAIHETIVKRWKPWSDNDRRFLALALSGEVGELLNLIKKEWRGDFNKRFLASSSFRTPLCEELADIRIYLELLAMSYGVDLDAACRNKIPALFHRWPEAAAKIRAGKCCVRHA